MKTPLALLPLLKSFCVEILNEFELQPLLLLTFYLFSFDSFHSISDSISSQVHSSRKGRRMGGIVTKKHARRNFKGYTRARLEKVDNEKGHRTLNKAPLTIII